MFDLTSAQRVAETDLRLPPMGQGCGTLGDPDVAISESTSISAPMARKPSICRLTGREPMAQPPGSETSACPNRATSGPNTRMEARMVFTSS